MPEISRFFGIRVEMFYDEHNPPHFHARYEGARASFGFDGSLIEGSFPAKAHRLIREWAALHAAELQEDWALAERHLPLKPIPSLT